MSDQWLLASDVQAQAWRMGLYVARLMCVLIVLAFAGGFACGRWGGW